jgi:hypothetical protein
MAPLVVVRLLGKLCELQAWGRASDGWWALVVWQVYVKRSDHNTHVYCSAWIRADQVEPSRNEEERRKYPTVTRTDLHLDRTTWPKPAVPLSWVCHHFGALEDAPPPLPGVEAIS